MKRAKGTTDNTDKKRDDTDGEGKREPRIGTDGTDVTDKERDEDKVVAI